MARTRREDLDLSGWGTPLSDPANPSPPDSDTMPGGVTNSFQGPPSGDDSLPDPLLVVDDPVELPDPMMNDADPNDDGESLLDDDAGDEDLSEFILPTDDMDRIAMRSLVMGRHGISAMMRLGGRSGRLSDDPAAPIIDDGTTMDLPNPSMDMEESTQGGTTVPNDATIDNVPVPDDAFDDDDAVLPMPVDDSVPGSHSSDGYGQEDESLVDASNAVSGADVLRSSPGELDDAEEHSDEVLPDMPPMEDEGAFNLGMNDDDADETSNSYAPENAERASYTPDDEDPVSDTEDTSGGVSGPETAPEEGIAGRLRSSLAKFAAGVRSEINPVDDDADDGSDDEGKTDSDGPGDTDEDELDNGDEAEDDADEDAASGSDGHDDGGRGSGGRGHGLSSTVGCILRMPLRLIGGILHGTGSVLRIILGSSGIIILLAIILLVSFLLGRGGVTGSSTNEGTVSVTGSSYSSGVMTLTLRNGSDFIAHVSGEADLRSWPADGIRSALSWRTTATCTFSRADIDPSSTRTIRSASCTGTRRGLLSKVRIRLSYE